MNAMRSVYTPVDRIRAWNADLERERARSLAEALMPADEGADGPASIARTIRTVDIEGRSTGSASRGERVTARRVVCECQIDTYHAQGHIDHAAHQAGLWFRRRYLLGYKVPTVTAGYERDRVNGGEGDPSVRMLDARHDLQRMSAALSLREWAAVEAAAGHDEVLGRGALRFLVSGLAVVALYREVGR